MTEQFLTVYTGLLLLLPLFFIIGSIPFGVIVTRGTGIDLRQTGSKNIGATNVLRTSGKVSAFLTLSGDTLKGAVAVLLARYIITNHVSLGTPDALHHARSLWEGAAGVTVVLGHIFSIFLSFRGGKGVATSFGVLAVFNYYAAGSVLFIWVLIAMLFRYSSLSALCAAAALPVTLFIFKTSSVKLYFGIIISVLIIITHRDNIQRLIRGTESRIGDRR